MANLTATQLMFAAQAAERHRTPKATVTHPKGVIVPHDALLTENIRDPDYVPYCGRCELCQRMRRVEDGFRCPTCGNKANWDLTKFNGNINVKFDPEYADAGWVAQWETNLKAVLEKSESDEEYIKNLTEQREREARNWASDKGKKNTSYHDCNKCTHPFFGKNRRKLCFTCCPRHLR